jgi:hypothetical protein
MEHNSENLNFKIFQESFRPDIKGPGDLVIRYWTPMSKADQADFSAFLSLPSI